MSIMENELIVSTANLLHDDKYWHFGFTKNLIPFLGLNGVYTDNFETVPDPLKEKIINIINEIAIYGKEET